eukprot:g11853.t1
MATLLDSGLPKMYWEDANRAANASRVLVPLVEGPYKGMTPWEIVTRTKIDPSFLQPVGCLCYVMMPTTTKGQPGAIPATYLGPNLYRRTYKVLLHNHRKPIVVDKRNVTFNPKGTQQWDQPPIFWQCGPGGPIFSQPLINDRPSQLSCEERQEDKDVVFEVVTPLQERVRAVQVHDAVGQSVGVNVPPVTTPTSCRHPTGVSIPEATVRKQAVAQTGSQRVGRIARVPILAAPHDYGKPLGQKRHSRGHRPISNHPRAPKPSTDLAPIPLIWQLRNTPPKTESRVTSPTLPSDQENQRSPCCTEGGGGRSVQDGYTDVVASSTCVPRVSTIHSRTRKHDQANCLYVRQHSGKHNRTLSRRDPKLPPIVQQQTTSYFTFPGVMLGQDTGRWTTDWDLA